LKKKTKAKLLMAYENFKNDMEEMPIKPNPDKPEPNLPRRHKDTKFNKFLVSWWLKNLHGHDSFF